MYPQSTYFFVLLWQEETGIACISLTQQLHRRFFVIRIVVGTTDLSNWCCSIEIRRVGVFSGPTTTFFVLFLLFGRRVLELIVLHREDLEASYWDSTLSNVFFGLLSPTTIECFLRGCNRQSSFRCVDALSGTIRMIRLSVSSRSLWKKSCKEDWSFMIELMMRGFN